MPREIHRCYTEGLQYDLIVKILTPGNSTLDQASSLIEFMIRLDGFGFARIKYHRRVFRVAISAYLVPSFRCNGRSRHKSAKHSSHEHLNDERTSLP